MQDQSLVGVLVGSIITTLFTWFLDYLKNGREEKGYFRRRKEEVYVQALDLFMAIPIDSNWGQSDLSENVKKRMFGLCPMINFYASEKIKDKYFRILNEILSYQFDVERLNEDINVLVESMKKDIGRK